ncbi:hypothetical protein LMIY3S_03543 [Labrys miyagiensis]
MKQETSFSLSSNRVAPGAARSNRGRMPAMEAEHQLMSMLASSGPMSPEARAELEKRMSWYQRQGGLHHAGLVAFGR